MSFDLTQKIKIVNPHSNVDELYGTYNSKAQALAKVVPALRQIGRTVGVVESGSVVEYWFKDGITDSDLIVKSSGGIQTVNSEPVTFTGNGTVLTPLGLTITPVSATLSGIVNNTSLQELGGVDKLINGARIGKGNGNFENNLTISRNGLASNTTGQYNIAIGNGDGNVEGVLQYNTTGSSNTGVGSDSLVSNTTGSSNTGIGSSTLFSNTTGGENTGIGAFSLNNNTVGTNNTGVGTYSLTNNTSGLYNTGVGDYTLWKNTTGQWNTAIGSAALTYNTTGQRNVALASALYWNTIGSHNSALGNSAGYANTTGNYNTYVGRASGYDNSLGSYNVGVGALSMIIAGKGYNSGGSVIDMNRNVFIGASLIGAQGMNDVLAIDNKGGTPTSAANALLYGGFSVANRFLNIGGKLSVTPSFMPTGDATYTKKLVYHPTTGVFAIVSDSSAINSGKERFTGDTAGVKTLAQTPITNSVSVILNGLELDEQGGDYTVATNTVTLATAPLTTDIIIIKYLY